MCVWLLGSTTHTYLYTPVSPHHPQQTNKRTPPHKNTPNSPRLVVVDLPGYGFAFGKEERVEQSQQLTLAYLRHRGAPLKVKWLEWKVCWGVFVLFVCVNV